MNPFYRVVRTIFRPILKVWNRMEVVGLENTLREGPAIVVANHHSYLDSFVLGAAYPAKIRFMVKKSQFTKPGTGWFYWGMDAFPVNQDGRDMESLREAMRTLKGGGILGIFPAGTRATSAEPAEWMPGVGMLARRSKAPVVPTAILGTYRAMAMGHKFPKPVKVRVVFGEPVTFPEDGGRDAMSRFVEDLRGRVAEMLRTARPTPGRPPTEAEGEAAGSE